MASTEHGSVAKQWIRTPRANPGARLRLLCLPYSGGAASIFHTWPQLLPLSVEVCAVELPGHGARILEKPFRRMEPLIDALIGATEDLRAGPFAVFGHSLGGTLAFELARELERRDLSAPRGIFVGGAVPPHCPHPVLNWHTLPDDELVDVLDRINGIPQQILQEKELLQLILPGIRGDLELLSTYRYVEEGPLRSPLWAFAGASDPLAKPEQIEAWAELSPDGFAFSVVEGGHFFLSTNREGFLANLGLALKGLVDEVRGRGPVLTRSPTAAGPATDDARSPESPSTPSLPVGAAGSAV
ncbi:MAG: alpha/beta fold hydrolase [Candidatus Binatia bacterium]|nr:alpha/beta fold hydrolase [Candidatus Binatia bacterium]